MPAVLSTLVFGITLFVIFSERINRTIAAIAGSAAMLILGTVMGFYMEEQAIEAIDLETIGLLLGMMILVALLEPTGFFEYMAVWAARLSRGEPMRLLVLLGTITSVLSMLLDNVTTVVLIAPVTILISEIMGINPTPLLITEALLSNTGGVATLVGDPPNVLIASAAGFNFNDFLVHSLPLIVVAWFGALLLLKRLFRDELASNQVEASTVLSLKPSEALNDAEIARKVLIVLGGALVFFFLERYLAVSTAFIALCAAALALLWVRPDMRKTLERIEWTVLIFFVALFVMVGGMEHAGALDFIARLFIRWSDISPVLLGLGLLWIVAILSAVVDNIPITIAMIPVILELTEMGATTSHLWWALAFGAGLGGNGTIIGSTANVVVASLSERTRTPIKSPLWNRKGLPVMLLTCFITSVLYALAFPLFLS